MQIPQTYWESRFLEAPQRNLIPTEIWESYLVWTLRHLPGLLLFSFYGCLVVWTPGPTPCCQIHWAQFSEVEAIFLMRSEQWRKTLLFSLPPTYLYITLTSAIGVSPEPDQRTDTFLVKVTLFPGSLTTLQGKKKKINHDILFFPHGQLFSNFPAKVKNDVLEYFMLVSYLQ